MEYINKIYTINEIIDVVKEIAPNYPMIEEIVLFGSYSRNEATSLSDIDLLITKPDKVKAIVMWSFLGDIKEILLKPIEIFRLSSVDKCSLFYENIKKDGLKIYEKTN